MKWAPNPYAIAQVLTDRTDLAEFDDEDGAKVDALLTEAFGRDAKEDKVAAALRFYEEVSDLVDRPMALAQAVELIKNRIPGQDLEKLLPFLPFLVPISNTSFEAIGGQQTAWQKDVDQITVGQATFLDPVQGAVGDCFLISAIIALAWSNPKVLETSLLLARGSSAGPFEWQFYDDDGRPSAKQITSRRIHMKGKLPIYARSSSLAEHWPALIEKTYVMMSRPGGSTAQEPDAADYQLIDNTTVSADIRQRTPQRACQALFGGNNAVPARLDGEASDRALLSPGNNVTLVNEAGVTKFPVMAWSKKDIGSTDPLTWEQTGIFRNHAYAVLGTTASNHIVLRNPHGMATRVRNGYQEGTWNPAGRVPVVLNRKGVFAISSDLFFKYFDNLGWLILQPPEA